MALLYYTNTKILLSGALLRTLGNATTSTYGPFTLGMTIYSGVAPTAASVAASWATYNTSTPDYLLTFTNAAWSQPSFGPLLSISTYPTAQTPVNTSTASWAIIWAGVPTPLQLSSTTLPMANFLIVGVSDSIGDGIIRFASTSFVTGSPVSVFDGNMACFL